MAYRSGHTGRVDRRQANLPYNKEGKIGSYAKDGGRRALERTKRGDETDVGDSGPRFKGRKYAPTIDQINQDRLTSLSNKYWSPHTVKQHATYTPDVIEDIYKTDLSSQEPTMRRTTLLEYSQYLENYLWPNFKAERCSKAQVMSIVMMVNEKFRERVPAWSSFQKYPEEFRGFFHRVMELSLKDTGKFTGFVDLIPKVSLHNEANQEVGEILSDNEENLNGKKHANNDAEVITLREQSMLLMFLDHCFTSLEVDLVRDQIQRLVSLSMWMSMLDRRRDHEFEQTPGWKRFWKAIIKKDKKQTDENIMVVTANERWFLKRLINKFFKILNMIQEREAEGEAVSYCEYFLLLMIGTI